VRFCLFSGTENGIYLRVESKRRGNWRYRNAWSRRRNGSKSITGYKKLKKRITFLSVTGSTSLKSPIGLKWSLFWGCAPRSVRRGHWKVAWLKPEEIPEALKNSYENIKLLFEEKNSWNRSFYL
jgi:hypothetical protein